MQIFLHFISLLCKFIEAAFSCRLSLCPPTAQWIPNKYPTESHYNIGFLNDSFLYASWCTANLQKPHFQTDFYLYYFVCRSFGFWACPRQQKEKKQQPFFFFGLQLTTYSTKWFTIIIIVIHLFSVVKSIYFQFKSINMGKCSVFYEQHYRNVCHGLLFDSIEKICRCSWWYYKNTGDIRFKDNNY